MEQEKLITELQAKVASLETENKTLNQRLKDVDTQASQAQITKLEETVKANEKKVSELETNIASLTQLNTELTQAKETAEKSAKTANEELENVKALQVKASRISKLVSAGLTEEEATAKTEKLAGVSEEVFNEIVALAEKGYKKPKKEMKDEDEDEDDADAGADVDELETTSDVEEPALGSEEENDNEEETILTAISSYLDSNYLGQKKNK